MSRPAIVLIIYALWNGLMQLEWLRFAPITTATTQAYGISETQVGWLALLFPLLFLPLALPAGVLIDRGGVRFALRLSAVLMTAGALLRCVSASYPWLVAGQTLFALAQPLVLAMLSPLVRTWFNPQHSLAAIGRASLAMFLGIAVAFVLVPWSTHLGVFASLRWDAGLLLALCLWTWMAIPPDTASLVVPCAPAIQDGPSAHSGLKRLLSRRVFIAMLLLIFLGNGYFNAIFTWLQAILARRGISAEAAGMVGMAMLAGGLLGMSLMSKLPQPARWLRLIVALSALTSLPLSILLYHVDNYPALLASGFVLGLGTLSPLPLLIDTVTALGAEHAGAALACFWLVGNLGAALFIWLLGMALDRTGDVLLCALLLAQLATAWLLLPGRAVKT